MRTTFRSTVPSLLAIALLAGTAHAHCDFAPGTGTKLKVPLVRAYEQCFYGATNATTEVGVNACTPVQPAPLRYECAETGFMCTGKDDYCIQQWCGTVDTGFFGTTPCVDNSDCTPDPPFFNGICEAHPGNVCAGAPGTRSLVNSFAPGGSCTLTATSKVVKDCSQVTDSAGAPLGLPVRECHVTRLKARCQKILDSSGIPLYDVDDGWALRTLTRATFDDEVGGDMTQIDFPVTFVFATPLNGSISLQTSSAEALIPILGTTGAALPPCTHLEPVDVRVVDPDGNVFARVGLATQP